MTPTASKFRHATKKSAAQAWMFGFMAFGMICLVCINIEKSISPWVSPNALQSQRCHETGWRKAHPAGSHWIDWYDGRDATEVMDGFHSEKGRNMYKRLPKSQPAAQTALDAVVAPDSKISLAFRQLRQELEDGGWWKRDMAHEVTQLAIWAGLTVGAVLTAHSVPPVSAILLGVAMTAAGWLGHDYIHAVDDFGNRMRNFACFAGGLSPTWWSDKHNKHHALSKLFLVL
jgi:hypothetical protein